MVILSLQSYDDKHSASFLSGIQLLWRRPREQLF